MFKNKIIELVNENMGKYFNNFEEGKIFLIIVLKFRCYKGKD